METRQIEKDLDELLDQLWQEVQEIDQQLKHLPRGVLYENSSHGTPQFQWKVNASDARRMYLSKTSEADLIEKLALRRYLEVLRTTDMENIELLEREKRILKKYRDRSEAYDVLPPGMKQRVDPKTISDEAYAKEWLSHMAGENFRDYSRKFRTHRGEWVRSKSEIIIANMLFEKGIPYKYEEPLWLNTRTVYPDFTILNSRTREEVYWEHLGKLDEKDYADKNCLKVEGYSEIGCQMGDRFLCTMETHDSQMSPEVAAKLLKKHFGDQFSNTFYEGWPTYYDDETENILSESVL